jgi:hypothetical protein
MQRRPDFCFFLIVLLLAVAPLASFSQSAPLKDKLWIEGKVHYGFVVPHHSNMVHLTSQHISMFEADLVQASNGRRAWEQQYHFPLKGISLLYSDLGGSDYLGKVAACIPYLDFNLTRKKKVNLFFRFGAGLGYLSKRFDRLDNYKNIAIGSHVNAAIQMAYEMRWKPAKRLSFNLGMCLTHFSNGAFKTPNLGINIFTVNAGMAWKITSSEVERENNLSSSAPKKPWEYRILAIGGVSELYAAGGPKFPAFILSASFLKPLGMTAKRRIGVGADLFYDEANVESLARMGTPVKHRIEVLRPGISFIHQYDFSRLSLVLQLGVYVYTRYKTDGYVFDRLALQYRFGKHYLVHLGLKTHFFTADMIEYGLGYKF